MELKHNARRRLFRLAGVGAALAGLGAAFATSAHAFSRGRHGPMDPAHMEEHLERMLKHLYVEIDASEEQKAKIGPLVKQAAKDLAPARDALRDTRKEALALLTAERVDRAGLEKLRANKLQAADAASRRLTQALSDVAEVLTPEQRKRLAEIASRHHRHHHHWHRR